MGWALAALGCTAAGALLDSHLRAAALLLRIEQAGEPTAGLSAYRQREVDQRPWHWGEGGTGFVFEPRGVADPPSLLLLHGVHRDGPDEPRQVAFARAIASTGITVATPRLPGLMAYDFSAEDVQVIKRAAREFAQRQTQAAVPVFGISIGGGLALRAACEQPEAGPIASVVALGGHHDLTRVARFYLGLGAVDPQGQSAGSTPDPYGLSVLMLRHLRHLLPEAKHEQGRALLMRRLSDEVIRPAQVRDDQLHVLLHDVPDAPLQAQLLGLLEAERQPFSRVSAAGCEADIRVPVYLLHGAGDRIVPASESAWLWQKLGAGARGRLLVSDAIAHAEYEPPSLWQRLQLTHFMAAVLDQVDRKDAGLTGESGSISAD